MRRIGNWLSYAWECSLIVAGYVSAMLMVGGMTLKEAILRFAVASFVFGCISMAGRYLQDEAEKRLNDKVRRHINPRMMCVTTLDRSLSWKNEKTEKVAWKRPRRVANYLD